MFKPSCESELNRPPGLPRTQNCRGARLVLGRRSDPLSRSAAPINADAARRIACDVQLIPVVLGTRGEPLDIGRASHSVPAAIRRAVIVWDVGCAFPGVRYPADGAMCTMFTMGGRWPHQPRQLCSVVRAPSPARAPFQLANRDE